MTRKTKKQTEAKIFPLQNLYAIIYKLKIRQIILGLFFISIILYMFIYIGEMEETTPFFIFFTRPPFPAFADACFTSVIIGFAFELFVRHESEASLHDQIDTMLEKQTISILDAIPQTMLLRKDIQKEILKNSKIDEIIINALQARLEDDQISEGIYNGIIRKIIAYEERWTNYRFDFFVEDITNKNLPEQIRKEYFDVIIRTTYDTKLKKNHFLFTCASNSDQFNDLMRNPDYEFRWLMPSSNYFREPNNSSFEVLQITVDNKQLSINPKLSVDGLYEIDCFGSFLNNKLGDNVTISYDVKVKVEKLGHALYMTVLYPTYDVTINFNFAKASIAYADVIDFFVSAEKPSIKYLPNSKEPENIAIRLKEWVFPKGGAAFVWILQEEQDDVLKKRKIAV